MLEDAVSSHQPELRRGDAGRPVFVLSFFDLLSPGFLLNFKLELVVGGVVDSASGLLDAGAEWDLLEEGMG
jgi:hypothetical protein